MKERGERQGERGRAFVDCMNLKTVNFFSSRNVAYPNRGECAGRYIVNSGEIQFFAHRPKHI